jgi:nicotinamidase-related amidase
MRIEREKSIGLIIDVQDRLFPVMDGKENFLSNCTRLIEGLQILGIPMIVTQQYTKGLGSTVNEISSLFLHFSPIEKNTFSCMDEPVFAMHLSNSGKTNVIICGIESHVCVLQTAVDLRENGYDPIVIADCISSRNPEEKQIALNRFLLEGIRISTTESILFELTRSAGTAEFKAISKLVK